MAATCSHLDSVKLLGPDGDVTGCEDCLASGGTWVHLRMCLSCGRVGCCDDSPSRHARAHHESSGHAIVRSVEPGEDWSFCFVDELLFRLRPR